MSSDEKTKTITTANSLAWQDVAAIHGEHNQVRLIEGFAKAGFTMLDAVETKRLEALGIAGKDVAQICCNNGRELLSVKTMGAARCVGFDGA